MFESFLAGIVQGIAEWLPISSEGFLTLLKVNFFQSQLSLDALIEYALLLHLGTAIAAIIYFRKEIFSLFKTLFKYNKASIRDKNIFNFILISSLISAGVGIFILKGIKEAEEKITIAGDGLTLIVGILLLATAFIQAYRKKTADYRAFKDLNFIDSTLLGVVQAFSILPGISRSGFTISTLLLRKIKEKEALKLSFLMSIPASIGANLLFNMDKLTFSMENAIGLITAFVVGLITIHLFIKIATKLNFTWFVFIFGALVTLSVFI